MILKRFSIFAFLGFIAACCPSREIRRPIHNKPHPRVFVDTIPKDIFEKFKEPMVKHVGIEFFRSRFRVQSTATHYPQEPRRIVYYCVWEVRFPESGESVRFTTHMNHKGKIFPKVVKLPRCVDNPNLCQIQVSREEALRIAASVVGKPPSWYWSVGLRSKEAFYWVVIVEPEDRTDWVNKRRRIEIDARTGEIIRKMSQKDYYPDLERRRK